MTGSAPPGSPLTPVQIAFLESFFAHGGVSDHFMLAGGTALAGFHLGHRHSDDVDLFTYEREAMPGGSRRVEDCLSSAGLKLTSRLGSPEADDYVRYSVGGDPHPRHPLRKIELIRDTLPLFAAVERFGNVRVMSLIDIAVAKLTAIGRMEVRDFVDLFVISRSGKLDLAALFPLAGQKDPGFSEFQLAADLMNVSSLRGPADYISSYLVTPCAWDDVVAFCHDLAGSLFQKYNPPRK